MTDYQPRRSVLYMPGSNQRALEKAKTLEADCLILDLEDAVAPSEKQKAREQVVAALQAGGYDEKRGEKESRREVAVRINGLDTEWGSPDLQAVLGTSAAAVVLPKVETAEQVQVVANRISPSSDMQVWAMIETPRGVQCVEQIAASHSRLNVLVMGTSDLSKELRLPPREDRLGLLYALSRCVLAARAAHLDIIDGVQLNLEDEMALRAVCEQGRDLGFDGKSLIHPKQIAVSNEVFSPAGEQIEQAEKIIQAWEQACEQGNGVTVVDGKLVENLHVEAAKRVLAVARTIIR